MTGSRFQLYNGIALMMTFFGSRVVWGNYQSIRIYTDMWAAMTTPTINLEPAKVPSVFEYRNSLNLNTVSSLQDAKLPMWLVFLYLGSNTLLNILNVYWFSTMVQTTRKRLDPSVEKKTQ